MTPDEIDRWKKSSSLGWLDRQGRPLTNEEVEPLLTHPTYKFIRQDILKNGVFLSTVWLGINHRFFGNGPPIIFESAAFRNVKDLTDMVGRRYATEEEALRGHFELMLELLEKWPRLPRKRKKRMKKAGLLELGDLASDARWASLQ